MSDLKTTTQVAALLERKPVTIRAHALRYGIGTKYAKTLLFTPEDIAALREITLRPPGVKKRSAP